MEAIVITIITGLFSLTGIWYQNYLSRKSVTVPQQSAEATSTENLDQTIASSSKKRKTAVPRIIFTMLIALIPWASSDYIFIFLGRDSLISVNTNELLHANYIVLRSETVAYYSVWFIITIIALMIGWKSKTIFEKIILIASAAMLIYTGSNIYIGYTHYIDQLDQIIRNTVPH
ncbi:MAG: hypothetical protein ACHQHN_05295 [Sphingobacteriales bacterium]